MLQIQRPVLNYILNAKQYQSIELELQLWEDLPNLVLCLPIAKLLRRKVKVVTPLCMLLAPARRCMVHKLRYTMAHVLLIMAA